VQPLRRRHRDRIAAPSHQAQVGDHEGDPERDQHLRQLLSGQAPQQEPFHQRAEHRDFQRTDDGGSPEIQGETESA
jgi:hypothetical protein